jgi:hypothetical protein
MNIQTTKIELVKMILNIENYEFIQKVTDFIKKNEKTDFWHDLSLSEQKEIKQGIEELNNGERIAYKDFLKNIS